MHQGITAVLDLLVVQDGQRTRNGAWVDVVRGGQPAGTALVQLTDSDGRVQQFRVAVDLVPAQRPAPADRAPAQHAA